MELKNKREIANHQGCSSVLSKNVTAHDVSGKTIYTVRRVKSVNTSHVFAFIKRAVDIFMSLFGIIVFLIPILIISLLIKIDSKGPVLYTQERLGKNSKKFKIYKFRSMIFDAEKDGPTWAKKNDDRVTDIGAILRKTHLDELPQFFNILKGEMSIVGPRPEREVFYKRFSEYIDGFDQRLLVKPGLTGWAQVNGGYELDPEEKVSWDIDYIENQSVMMDIKCILRTSRIVFGDEKTR